MPRNGSDGTYLLSDTIAPSTLADANELQAILNDVQTAFTGSLAADGQTPTTGQLKGLVSANPVYSFNGDSDTGWGSDTANEMFGKCGGTKIAKLSSAGLDVLSGALLVAGGALVPVGMAVDYVGTTAPAGWVIGNGGSLGNAVSGGTLRANADAEPLFTLIWNSANVASGEGQVQDSAGSNVARGANPAADFAANRRILVADYQDRVSRGKSGSTALGQMLGADAATVAQANLPNVNFTVTDPGHFHSFSAASQQNPGQGAGGPNNLSLNTSLSTNTVTTGITVASGGSGTALDVKPKSIVKTKIIKL